MSIRITTEDNPFDPFDQFEAWAAWDSAAGYETLSYLARVAYTFDELSDADQAQAYEDAAREIVAENPFMPYKILERAEGVDKD